VSGPEVSGAASAAVPVVDPTDLKAIRLAARLERVRREREPDPLKVLLEDDDAPVLWEYSLSRTDPEIPGHLHEAQKAALEQDVRHRFLFWGNQAQPVDEPVLTPSGWRAIGELRVGDEVMAGDGSVTRVVKVTPQGLRPVFWVEFDDGARTRCSEDHLWRVRTPRARIGQVPGPWVVLSLRFLMRRWYGLLPRTGLLCSVPRLPEQWSEARGRFEDERRLERIRRAGEEECVCIGVEHPEGTYVTRDYVVTHNSGKTTLAAVECVLLALGRHPNQWTEPPVRIWASALSWDLWERILLPELLTWIPPGRLLDAPQPYIRSTKRDILIRADNGKISRITGKSAEQGAAKYQSARVHLVWLDEEHPRAVWYEMQPRLVRFGGRTLSSMTPLKGFTWVYDEIYQPWERGELEGVWCSHAGIASNPGIPPENVEELERMLSSNPAQLAARLHGRFAAPQGLALPYEPRRHLQGWKDREITDGIREGRLDPFGGIDFGRWRFAFHLLVADRAGRVHVVDEYFSQRESLSERAEWIHVRLTALDVPPSVRLWGDNANPSDIVEINAAFKRIGSPYRVIAVTNEEKRREAAVERMCDLLARGALLFRRDLGARSVWRVGMRSDSDGVPVTGSRLLWELRNWCYPEPKEGKAQSQTPDDNSADGADCIAALRYALMSWWKAASHPQVKKRRDRNVDARFEKVIEQLNRAQKRGRRHGRGPRRRPGAA